LFIGPSSGEFGHRYQRSKDSGWVTDVSLGRYAGLPPSVSFRAYLATGPGRSRLAREL